MFVRSTRCLKQQGQIVSKRFNHHEASHHASTSTSEVNIPKAIGGFVLAGITLFFYRSQQEDPIIKTPLYKQSDDREILRNENYLRRYKTSFIKTFIKDKGGIGSRQLNREKLGGIPTTLIQSPSAFVQEFGAGIKTDKLGPRRERPVYFAPLK